MGEDEGGAGDVADLAGAGGDVLQDPPAAGEQGEATFTQAAQRVLDRVTGAGIDVEFPAAPGLFDGNQDADARAVGVRLPGVPQVDGLALDADGRLFTPVA